MGNNPKLDLVNVDVYTKFCLIFSSHSQDIERKQNVHGMTEPRNDGTTEGQGESSIAPLFQSGAIIICMFTYSIISLVALNGSTIRNHVS